MGLRPTRAGMKNVELTAKLCQLNRIKKPKQMLPNFLFSEQRLGEGFWAQAGPLITAPA